MQGAGNQPVIAVLPASWRLTGGPGADEAVNKQYLERPFFGSRRMAIWLRGQGYRINRKRVVRLMGAMGLRAIYRRPRTSKPGLGHRVYPYLLRSMRITRPNQVWAADITYVVPRQLYLPVWRQLGLPVHLLGLAPLLGSVGPVAGDVKLQDDGVVHHPVNRRGGGHGVGKYALPL